MESSPEGAAQPLSRPFRAWDVFDDRSQGVALGWHVPRRWRSKAAAVKTSITSPGGSANAEVRVAKLNQFVIRNSSFELLLVAHQRHQRGPLRLSVDAVVAPRLLHPAGCASLRLFASRCSPFGLPEAGYLHFVPVRGIPCRSALLLRQLLAFGDFLKLRFELRQSGGVQAQLGTEGAKWGD